MIGPKRFWTTVAVVDHSDDAAGEGASGFGVRLDDRALRTPAHAPLRVPTRAFAEAVAAEWRELDDVVRPEALPYTRAANVAIDRVGPARLAVVAQIAAYGETDLLCYRAAEPEGLRRRQAAGWDPMLDWSAAALGAPLAVTEGVMHGDQPPTSLAALRAAVAAHDAFALTALHELVTLSGSLVLGLAVARGALAGEAAWDLSRIDEDWQAEQWGRDDEAEAAAGRRRADFLRAASMLEFLADAASGASMG